MTVKLVIQLNRRGSVPVPAGPARADSRVHKRLPVDYRFSIYADGSTGPCILARSINMSKAGALIEVQQPIPIGSLVYVRIDKLGLMGSGEVRHCTAKGSRFRIGLHFPTPLVRCQ